MTDTKELRPTHVLCLAKLPGMNSSYYLTIYPQISRWLLASNQPPSLKERKNTNCNIRYTVPQTQVQRRQRQRPPQAKEYPTTKISSSSCYTLLPTATRKQSLAFCPSFAPEPRTTRFSAPSLSCLGARTGRRLQRRTRGFHTELSSCDGEFLTSLRSFPSRFLQQMKYRRGRSDRLGEAARPDRQAHVGKKTQALSCSAQCPAWLGSIEVRFNQSLGVNRARVRCASVQGPNLNRRWVIFSGYITLCLIIAYSPSLPLSLSLSLLLWIFLKNQFGRFISFWSVLP